MKNFLDISLISCNQTACDLTANGLRIIDGIKLAKSKNCQIVCFSELSVSAYGCQDHFYNYNFICAIENQIKLICNHCQNICVLLSAPVYCSGNLYNCVLVINDGNLIAVQPKKILADSNVHYESRWFSRWSFNHYCLIDYAGFHDVYFGDLYYKFADYFFGIEICEESWNGFNSLNFSDNSLDLIFHISASHFSIKKHNKIKNLVTELSRNYCCHYLYCNGLGIDSGRIIYDGSMMWAANGNLNYLAKRFVLDDLSISSLKLDIDFIRCQKLTDRSDHKKSHFFDTINQEYQKNQKEYQKYSDQLFFAKEKFNKYNSKINSTKNLKNLPNFSNDLSFTNNFKKPKLINITNQLNYKINITKKNKKPNSVPLISSKNTKNNININSIYTLNSFNISSDLSNKNNNKNVKDIATNSNLNLHLHAQNTDHHTNQELLSALTLALFDYLKKSKMRGFVVSLSGGRDSAITSILVKQMILSACKHHGIKKFLQLINRNDLLKLINHSDLTLFNKNNEINQKTINFITKNLLITIYQPSKNSSENSKQSSNDLAKYLGSNHITKNIDKVVFDYSKDFEKIFDIKLNWSDNNLTLQNIQSRCRSPFAWMVANYHDFILLNTSNRSELSVGYFSIDGDSTGGLGPISGLSKIFINQWLQWYKNVYHCDALEKLLSNEPSAELCPESFNQTDQKDLMPYEILCQLEHLFMFEKKSKKTSLDELIKHFPSINPKILENYIDKFVNLFKDSQWKRAKIPVGFYTQDLNCDPKNCQRYPELHNLDFFYNQ